MIDRERAIELVAQGMVEAYSSNDCPRAPDIEEATKIVDALLALSDPLVSDLEHRLRVLAEAAVEDEAEIERLRAVEDAARLLVGALEEETIPGRIGLPYARVKGVLANGKRHMPVTDEMVRRAADAMPHHQEPSFWWSDSTYREILRRVLDAAING